MIDGKPAASYDEAGTASGFSRRPSLSGGMPRWAPAPVTDEKPAANSKEGGEHKDGTRSAAKEVGKPEVPVVRVNDWLAAAAGVASMEVRRGETWQVATLKTLLVAEVETRDCAELWSIIKVVRETCISVSTSYFPHETIQTQRPEGGR